MKPHPASSMQHTDADSSTAEHEAVSPSFHNRLGGSARIRMETSLLEFPSQVRLDGLNYCTHAIGKMGRMITGELSLGFPDFLHLHRKEEADW